MTTRTNTAADEFYTPIPDDFTAPVGVLLRTRDAEIPAGTGAGHAWQVVYSTRTAFHAPLPASGLVLAPADTVANDGSTLAYCPVFGGLGQHTAPSQRLGEAAVADVAAALAQGWIVVVPDGQGVGMTGLGAYPFLSGAAAAHTVLDLARAVTGSTEIGGESGACAVWGYADGGRAAVLAAETQPAYAPDLDLRGVAAGAVVANPRALVADLDAGPWAGLVFAGMVGLARAYSHLPVTHLLTENGRRGLAHAQTLTLEQLLDTYRDIPLGTWCERREPWNDPLWRYVLAAETAALHAPDVPVHLYHGTEDELIPIAHSRALFAEYRALGVDLSWREYDTDHTRTATVGAREALTRLRGFLLRRRTPPAATVPRPPAT
ncbi:MULTISPECIES: lipase family protein [Nocardia]|uniref:lipase family protein n=1 Tax=Nocardia TaxID=1817 RepID=UPI000310A682|nr:MULTISPECIES: lipase family protein [Nocardia]